MKSTDDNSNRGGLPSGSSAKRYKNCPGSFMRERELAAADLLVDNESEIAKEGTLLHAVMAGKMSEIGLCDRHGYLIRTARRLRDKAISVCGFEVTDVFADAQREWLLDPDTGERIGSGLVDYYAPSIEDSMHLQALMLDWKFGPKGADDAEDNDQLDWYVAIKKQQHPELKRLIAGIVQPAVEGDEEDRLTLVEYDEQALIDNLQRVVGIARVALKEGQACCAGPWCRNCPSIGRCDTAASIPIALGLTAQMVASVDTEAKKVYLDAPVLPKELDMFTLAEWVIEARRRVAIEQMRETPGCIEGWSIPEPTARSGIDDTKEALARLTKTFPGVDFTPAMKLSLTDTSKVLHAYSNSSVAQARQAIVKLLDGCITTELTNPAKPQRAKKLKPSII